MCVTVEGLPVLKRFRMLGIQDRLLTLKFEPVELIAFYPARGVHVRLLHKLNQSQVDEAHLELHQLMNTNWTHSFV